jgi:hypothetical protein
VDYERIDGAPCPQVDNLDLFNVANLYLTAKDDPTLDPDWLTSIYGKPIDDFSDSTSVIVTVDKSDITGEEGIVDAFYFYFYSFNQGNSVRMPLISCLL